MRVSYSLQPEGLLTIASEDDGEGRVIREAVLVPWEAAESDRVSGYEYVGGFKDAMKKAGSWLADAGQTIVTSDAFPAIAGAVATAYGGPAAGQIAAGGAQMLGELAGKGQDEASARIEQRAQRVAETAPSAEDRNGAMRIRERIKAVRAGAVAPQKQAAAAAASETQLIASLASGLDERQKYRLALELARS